jgi:arylsulfatase A-like enzyme
VCADAASAADGRNHHSAGMGCITELATGAPGYTSVRPNTMPPLPQTLKLNGYSTAQLERDVFKLVCILR